MKSNYLRLEFESDTDGTGELIAEFCSNDYSGKGSAWFDVLELVKFSEKLQAYPILKESPVEIAGGYWNNEKKGSLKEIHFSFKAYPIGAKGNIGIRIRVSTPIPENGRPESQHVAEAEIQTSYNELGSFANQLKELIEGKIKQAVLES